MSEIYNGSFVLGNTSATTISAGPGIKIDDSTPGVIKVSNDETVLYSGGYNTSITSCQLSESVTNFQYIKVDWQRGPDESYSTTLETSIYPSTTNQFNHIGKQNQSTNYYYEYHGFWDVSNGTAVNYSRTFLVNYPKAGGNITTYQNDYNEIIPVKIIGINRISGGN